MCFIRLKSIAKSYSLGKQSVTALRKINIEIQRGEFLSITGNSGSGKTTLMNIIGCLDTPDSGSYLLCGENVSHYSQEELSVLRNRTIGFVFQSFHLIPTLTALENVELPLTYCGISKSKRVVLAKEALYNVGLEKRMNHFPQQLSGGQQQRTAIARAIVNNPDLLLADEPTGNLDQKAGQQIVSMLAQLNRMGKTVILITHDTKLANSTSRRIEIQDGMIFSDSSNIITPYPCVS